MAGHVYVSYDGQDVGYVRRLVDHLAASWLTVWVDKEAGTGDHWYPELEAPIRAASVVLVIMSPASQNSDRVRGEIMYAHRIGRTIVPLLLAGRPFFSQSGTPPENVIGGFMPDDELIDRLGELSQTPITHRKSGKPGRGSASRERESTGAGSPLRPSGYGRQSPPASPVSSYPASSYPVSSYPVSSYPVSSYPVSSYPVSSYPVSSYPVSSRPVSSRPVSSRPVSSYGAPSVAPESYEDDPYDSDDDDRPRRLTPAVLATVAGVVVLVMGIVTVVVFAVSGPDKQQTTTVGATNARTTAPTPTSGPPAAPGLTPTAPALTTTSTSKKPTTTTSHPGAVTTTTTTTTTITTSTITTTEPPPIPGVSLSLPASVVINGSTNGTVTLDAPYPSNLTITLASSGSVTVPTTVDIPANQTSVQFTVTAGPDVGPANVTASVSGHTSSASIDVTAA